MKPRNTWREAEDALALRLLNDGLSRLEIGALMGYGSQYVGKRLKGAGVRERPQYTPEEVALLRELSEFLPDRVIADLLGRQVQGVQKARQQHARLKLKMQAWSEADVAMLTALYPTHSSIDLGVMLNRNPGNVSRKARCLGLSHDGLPRGRYVVPAELREAIQLHKQLVKAAQ